MSSNLWALLIGVDFYFPNRLPDGGFFPNLGGCVHDVDRMEAFLRTRLGLRDERLFKLTASDTGQSQPPEPIAQWPTHANLLAALTQLTQQAQAGDQVYIHYSGHGGRATTIYPQLKGAQGIDETLVPTDIGHAATPYLRDVELAHLLQEMVDRGLLVTLVLDSCHSGGATRGLGGVRTRGISSIDTTPRPTASQMASPDVLAATWNTISGGNTRVMKVGSGWLIEPKGYTLLAACRGTELANEANFEGEAFGVLTYWLLDTLRQLGPALNYKMLHERILAKVHSEFPNQSPQLQGENDRAVFGSERVQPHFATTVLDVEPARLRLDAGQVHGLRKGAQFAIYPQGADLTSVEQRLALVTVAELGSVDAWATITTILHTDPIEQGAQAALLDSGNIKLQRPVRFAPRADLLAQIDQATALAKAQAALVATNSTFARLANEGESVAFQVAVNEQSEYEVWDPIGQPLANLRPALAISDPDAPAKMAQRLIHLARFRNVQELSNSDALSPLARALAVDLLGKQGAAYDPADPPDPQPIPVGKDGRPTIQPEEWLFLRIRNLLPKRNDPLQPWLNSLNITLLCLQSDWGIVQIYPGDAGSFALPLDAGGELVLPLQGKLPPAATQSTDVLKVFATLDTTNFRWLELPALDQPPVTRSRTRGGGDGTALEDLLAAVVYLEPRTRTMSVATAPSKGWVTAQVEVTVTAD